MKLIHLTWSVLISISACAQNTENLLKNHFNPVFSEELKVIKIYKTKLGIQMHYMRYADRDKISSGNEQTNEPYKFEISLYLKWKN